VRMLQNRVREVVDRYREVRVSALQVATCSEENLNRMAAGLCLTREELTPFIRLINSVGDLASFVRRQPLPREEERTVDEKLNLIVGLLGVLSTGEGEKRFDVCSECWRLWRYTQLRGWVDESKEPAFLCPSCRKLRGLPTPGCIEEEPPCPRP
jgi:hypothetical protein